MPSPARRMRRDRGKRRTRSMRAVRGGGRTGSVGKREGLEKTASRRSRPRAQARRTAGLVAPATADGGEHQGQDDRDRGKCPAATRELRAGYDATIAAKGQEERKQVRAGVRSSVKGARPKGRRGTLRPGGDQGGGAHLFAERAIEERRGAAAGRVQGSAASMPPQNEEEPVVAVESSGGRRAQTRRGPDGPQR